MVKLKITLMTKMNKMAIMVVEEEALAEVQAQVLQIITRKEANLKHNSKKIKSLNLRNKLVDFVVGLIKNSMMSHLTYITGKNVQCLYNAGSVAKL